MNMWDAEQQANALARLAVPMFLLGLFLFIEALIEPFSQPVHDVVSWFKFIPIAMAIYIQSSGSTPSIFGQYIDDYAQKTVMLAGDRAGWVAIIFLLATLIVDNYDAPWTYENAVDITFGVYLMTMGSSVWWEMREDPEPALDSDPESEEHS
jgi:hypothetical protein